MRTLATLALLGFAALASSPATAAPASAASTAAAQCAAANQKSTKLRAAHSLRQARDQALACSAVSCTATVRAACRKRAADVLAAIPTITFAVKDSAGHDVTDVAVSMDGESLADHVDGSALSVDPGQHTFTFQVAGQPSLDQPFLIKEGEKGRREVVTLPAPPAPSPPVAVVVSPGAAPDADTGVSGAPRGSLRTVAFVLGGIGVAGLAVGGVTGGLAISKWNASQSECASPSQCAQHAQSVTDHNSASSLATVSTITFIAGGAALAAGATLFFVSPKSTTGATQAASLRIDPILGPGGGGFTVKGAF